MEKKYRNTGCFTLLLIPLTILLGLILFDRANYRNYKPYILALSLFLVYQISFQLIYVRS